MHLTIDGIPDYHGTCGIKYYDPQLTSYTCVKVLPFLNGLPWDNLALGYVHSLRPSMIRVTTGEMTCDSRAWRVSVIVDKQDVIQWIEQEVEVSLYGWQNAAALRTELESRIRGQKPQGPPTQARGDEAFVYCPYIPIIGKNNGF